MEMRDGFILGVYNYCDRWCETCSLTSRCRLFADSAAIHASLDRNFKALVDAPPLPEEAPTPPPRRIQELFEEANKEADAAAEREPKQSLPEVLPQHASIQARANRYCSGVHAWLQASNSFDVPDPSDPRAVVHWFCTMIPAKVARALCGLAEDEPEERDWPADHDGSAKVALLGIDRSHAAWLEIAERGLASAAEIAPFIEHLVNLGLDLERVFPNARAFVRPAFDEPDDLAKLAAADRML
jgi:hypothetical protein